MFMLNPKRFGPEAFTPEDGGALSVWYDFSDAASLTVAAGSPDVITDAANKAAADSTNDANLDDSATAAAGLEQESARINGLDAGLADDSPERALITPDNTQAFTRMGTGGFRIFFVIETLVSEAIVAIPWTNGVRTNEGGAMNFTINFPASGDVRWQLADILSSGHAVGEGIVLDANNDVMDGDPHIIMIGRSIGTGAGGVDQLIGSIDGVVPTGLPVDLASGFGSVNNTGAVNAATGWLIMGGHGQAPDRVDFPGRMSFGEMLAYKTDMTSGQESAVIAYLKAKWGVA